MNIKINQPLIVMKTIAKVPNKMNGANALRFVDFSENATTFKGVKKEKQKIKKIKF